MLQSIRDRLHGPIIGIIVALIVVPFAFWGIQSFRDGGGDPTVAKVGGVRITQAQFRRAYENYLQVVAERTGSYPDAEMQKKLRGKVLDAMVEQTALQEFALEAGYRTSDADLMNVLRINPAFQKDGAFSAERYRQVLAARGQSAAQFESQMRENLTIDQVQQDVLGSAFINPDAVELSYRIAQEKRSFAAVKIDPARFTSGITVTDDQVKAQYEAHKGQYLAPERVKLAYVELSEDRLPKAPVPSVDVLKAIYDTEKASRFSVPEERHASHILIDFGADKAASRKKAEAILAKLKSGADFAATARAESDDAGSKRNGGDLGWIRHGQMVPAFESALFHLQVGQLSDIVESPYGWHIIKLDGIHPAATKPFDDASVQKQLIDLYQQRDASQRFRDDADKLEQLAFENPSSLDAVSKTLDLPVQTTDWLKRDSRDGIAGTPAVLEAAFSSAIIHDGENSKPIPVGPTDLVVIRKVDYEAPRQQTLDEVSGQIRDQLKMDAAKAKAKRVAEAIEAAVRGGQTLETAAKAQGLTVDAVTGAARGQAGIDSALLEKVFQMARPEEGKPRLGQVTLAQGVVDVIQLTAVQAADGHADADSNYKQLASMTKDMVAGAEFEAYRKAVQRRVGVKLYPDRVDDL